MLFSEVMLETPLLSLLLFLPQIPSLYFSQSVFPQKDSVAVL